MRLTSGRIEGFLEVIQKEVVRKEVIRKEVIRKEVIRKEVIRKEVIRKEGIQEDFPPADPMFPGFSVRLEPGAGGLETQLR